MTFIIASVFNFSLVLILLIKLLRKPAGQFVRSRSETLAESVKEAETAFDQAKSLFSKWEANWKEAKAHAQEYFDGVQSSFQRQEERVLTEAKKQTDRIRVEGEALREGEVNSAKRAIQLEIVELSVDTAGDYLKKSLEPKERKQLVSHYLEAIAR